MLFNKNGKGSEELYGISGIFQASTDYRSIAAEIDSATAEVAAIVGSAVMESAEEIYDKEAPTDGEKALLAAVRLPVAYLAIGMYSKLAGVSHGDTGRKMKVGDDEKIPFEWMIDRDDRELRERYYRALDALIRHLEATENESWKNSDTRSSAADCLVGDLTAVERVYPIEHSYYMFYRLLPIFLEIQQTKLRKVVGDENYAKLLQKDASVADILPQAMRFIVLRALIVAVQRWSIDSFPLSIARRFSPSYQGNRERRAATTEEIDWYVSKLELQAQDAALELQAAGGTDPYENLDLIPENDPRKKYFTV